MGSVLAMWHHRRLSLQAGARCQAKLPSLAAESEALWQIELPLERGDLSQGTRNLFEIDVGQDLGQLEGLTVTVTSGSHPSPWHLSHVEVCCPSGTALCVMTLGMSSEACTVTCLP